MWNAYTLNGPVVPPPAGDSLRHAVHAALTAFAPLAAVVGDRVYHAVATETVVKGVTCVAYQVASQDRPGTLDRPGTIAAARVQVACFGESLAEVEAAAEAVRQLFHGFTGVLGGVLTVAECHLDGDRDLPEPPRDGSGRWTYRTILDVLIRYREPVPDRFD